MGEIVPAHDAVQRRTSAVAWRVVDAVPRGGPDFLQSEPIEGPMNALDRYELNAVDAVIQCEAESGDA